MEEQQSVKETIQSVEETIQSSKQSVKETIDTEYILMRGRTVDSDIQKSYSDKKWVWIPTKTEDAFVSGYIIKEEEETMEISINGKPTSIKKEHVYKMNPPKFDLVDDLAALSYLNEPSVLYNIMKRYNQSLIYTYSGLFLLAVNPYRDIKIYSDKHIKKYSLSKKYELEPHIFAVANEAYNSLLANRENQSILITGESGAGKTENTKRVIEFLASVSTSDSNVDKMIIDSNPILEAFGNAKTLKNDNSSRFGKFVQIKFQGGAICGAHIEKYLLEKSRVTRQGKGERNYHIFYQLIKGAEEELKKEILLTGRLEDYSYTKDTPFDVPSVDDKKNFQELRRAFKVLKIGEEEEKSFYKIVSAILHLGNVEFTDSNGGIEIVDIKVVERVCSLLSIPLSEFVKCLLHPVIKAGREVVAHHRTSDQARRIIDALSKILYDKMFDSVIERLNKTLGTSSSSFIGVLDIAGFEIYKTNSFEQLCINYTNEKLQQFFNHHMFILEQEIYKQEKIEWDFIDFGLDLQPTIDLIEKNNPIGILSYLDEECVMPMATEKTFLSKLTVNIKSDKFLPERFKDGFKLVHYAGQVEYSVEDWLSKNMDPHSESLTSLVGKSVDSNISKMHFLEEGNVKKGIFRTVSQKHKEQLTSLMKNLSKTNPHFVRCILPNMQKSGEYFENRLILEQLKCNGVLEGIRISRQGYPSRMKYKEFVERYSLLSSIGGSGGSGGSGADHPTNTSLSISGRVDLHEKSLEILNSIKIRQSQFRLGQTKIFFRQGILADIEDMRDHRISMIMREVQSILRRKITVRQESLESRRRNAILLLQKNGRMIVEMQKWKWWKLYLKIKPLLDVRKRDNEIKEKDKAIERYLNMLEEGKKMTAESERRRREIEEELEKKMKEEESEKEFIKEKEELIAGLRKKIKGMEEEMKELRNNKVKEEEVEKGKEEIKRLEREIMNMKEEATKTKKKTEEKISDMQVENERLEEVASKIKKEIEEVEGRMKKIQGEVDYEKVRNGDLKNQVENFRNGMRELERMLEEERKKEVIPVIPEKKVTKMVEKIKHLERVNLDLSEENDRLHRENLEILKTKLDEIFETETSFNMQKKSMQMEINRLADENNKLKGELHDSDESTSTTEKMYALLEEEKKARREMEGEVMEKKREIRRLKGSLEESLEGYYELKKKVEDTLEKVNRASSETILNMMERSKKRILDLIVENGEKESRIVELEGRKIPEVEVVYERDSGPIEEIKKKYEERMREVRENEERREKMIEEIREEYKKSLESIKEIEEKNEKKMKEREEKEKKILNTRIFEEEKKVESLKNKLEEMKKERGVEEYVSIQERDRKIGRLEEERKRRGREMGEMKNKVEDLQREIGELKKENVKNTVIIEQLKKEVITNRRPGRTSSRID